MWIARRRRALKRNPAISIGFVCALMATAVLLKLYFPNLPTLSILTPAVIIGAFLGGRMVGFLSLALGTVVAAYFVYNPPPPSTTTAQTVAILIFVGVGLLIIFILSLLDEAIRRLEREQVKLQLVLKAAKAASWEFDPSHPMNWDNNFFDLLGLPESEGVPSAEKFLAMVSEEDRPKMRKARELMSQGLQPPSRDEYRLKKPDGSWLWLVNHRVQMSEPEKSYVGLTLDITEQKAAQEEINFLLQELIHRSKNQFTVINSIARDVIRQSVSTEDFERQFQLRMISLAKSQDLVAKGSNKIADLEELVRSQAEIFGAASRIDIAGPSVGISELAAQYLSIALYELMTNSIKYGALATEDKRLQVSWQPAKQYEALEILWKEEADENLHKYGPATTVAGFGTKVLKSLVASALGGSSELTIGNGVLEWKLQAPFGVHLHPQSS